MPYDPAKPVENTDLDAAEMRAQLQGLKSLIDGVPTIGSAQVDGVNTLNPGDPAEATAQVNGNTVHFTFSIPRGSDGTNGADGSGVSGATVDGVTTLDPNQGATANVNFDTGGRCCISTSASHEERSVPWASPDRRVRLLPMRWWTG